jgi:hypothetical protein
MCLRGEIVVIRRRKGSNVAINHVITVNSVEHPRNAISPVLAFHKPNRFFY